MHLLMHWGCFMTESTRSNFFQRFDQIKAMAPFGREQEEWELTLDFLREVADTGGTFHLKAKKILELLEG